MGQRRAFRLARRAGRVEDDGRIAGIHRQGGHRFRRLDPVAERRVTGALAHHDVLQRRQRRPVDRLTAGLGRETGPGARVFEQERHLRLGQRRVNRNGDRAGPDDPQIAGDELGDVRQVHRDAVAPAHASRPERSRHPAGEAVELAVGQFPPLEEDGGTPRVMARPSRQSGARVHPRDPSNPGAAGKWCGSTRAHLTIAAPSRRRRPVIRTRARAARGELR
jgi:hypothetical protein